MTRSGSSSSRRSRAGSRVGSGSGGVSDGGTVDDGVAVGGGGVGAGARGRGSDGGTVGVGVASVSRGTVGRAVGARGGVAGVFGGYAVLSLVVLSGEGEVLGITVNITLTILRIVDDLVVRTGGRSTADTRSARRIRLQLRGGALPDGRNVDGVVGYARGG